MDYITIFGSCRQQPIKEYFSVSNIQDNLNYPHYTKEILQEIRYLKYKNIPNEFTKYCFRNGLVSNCEKEILDSEYDKLKEDFDKTTFFLIEIASRLSYEWNNLYMHHIAEDEQYGFHSRNNIIRKDMTDEEIEDDIIQIKNELYPKPFIIISHFSTYETGKRYELTQLLKKICEKMNIPFLNQSDIVKEHGINILVNEPVLAHYNEEGTRIVAKKLFDKMNEVKENNIELSMKQHIYQVYYSSEERIKKYNFHGFGDFIRGTTYLYQALKEKNIFLKVNFSNHTLSNFFVCDTHVSIDDCENDTHYFLVQYHNRLHDIVNCKLVFCNYWECSEIDDECRKFIIQNCLTPKVGFEKKILNIKNTLNISDYNYSIVHIRVLDEEMYSEERLINILSIILDIRKKNKEELIVMSSSDLYLNYINFPFIKKTNLSVVHTGMNTTDIKNCEDTMIEFMLMITCKKIYQLSVYFWGSGFSDTVNKIYNVPIEKYSI
jgi:hypothetical protein